VDKRLKLYKQRQDEDSVSKFYKKHNIETKTVDVFVGEGKTVEDAEIEDLVQTVKLSREAFSFSNDTGDKEQFQWSIEQTNAEREKEKEGRATKDGRQSKKKDHDEKQRLSREQEKEN